MSKISKKKTTVYLSEEDEQRLDELFIKRIRDKKRTKRSNLVCEAIKLLFEKEMEHKKRA